MKYLLLFAISILASLSAMAQPPANVGCMLNESGQLRMYYGSYYKFTQGGSYRYIYNGSSYYTYSDGTSCPSTGAYFQFGALYTENGVPIGCHRTADFGSPLGEMRYFSFYYCPLDENLPWAIGVCVLLYFSFLRKRSGDWAYILLKKVLMNTRAASRKFYGLFKTDT